MIKDSAPPSAGEAKTQQAEPSPKKKKKDNTAYVNGNGAPQQATAHNET
jgi:hypothetical protein